mmetsp:Transcript_113809/g.284684  ORF Transcript_113809/g.284684 Transcript_113809/m.284684 type:complete len:212 (+) Transcript_113809:1776-2411(+)
MLDLMRKASTSLTTMFFIPGWASTKFFRWKETFEDTLAAESPNLLTSIDIKALSCSGFAESRSKAVRMALVLKKVTDEWAASLRTWTNPAKAVFKKSSKKATTLSSVNSTLLRPFGDMGSICAIVLSFRSGSKFPMNKSFSASSAIMESLRAVFPAIVSKDLMYPVANTGHTWMSMVREATLSPDVPSEQTLRSQRCSESCIMVDSYTFLI